MNPMRPICFGFAIIAFFVIVLCLDIIYTKTGIGRIGLTLPNDIFFVRFFFVNDAYPHQFEIGSHTNKYIHFVHEF